MGFQLTNYWFESLDYANRITSLNDHQARPRLGAQPSKRPPCMTFTQAATKSFTNCSWAPS